MSKVFSLLPQVLASALSFAAVPACALTLSEAQALLFRDNADLAMLRLEAEKAASQAEEAKGAWFPSVDAVGSYGFTTETPRLRLDLPLPAPGGATLERSLGDQDKVEVGLDATVPLFTGFSRGHAVEARQAQARAREAQSRAAHNQLSLRLAALFYAWQLASRQAEYQAKVGEHARQLAAQLGGFVKAGTAVRSRALAAEARARAAEVDFLAAEGTRDSLALEVLDFIGGGHEAAATGTGPAVAGVSGILVADTTGPGAPPWLDAPEGGGHRPEEHALEESLLQARLGAKALAGQRLPQIHGMAGIRYGNPGLNMNDDEFMAYGLAGVQLKWNLFDGFRNRQQRRQLHLQARVIEEQRRKLRNEWKKALETSRLQHARWSAQLEAAQASREAARAAAADLQLQLESGLATEVDLTEARNHEARADLVVQQARTFQKLAQLQWRFAAGREMRF